VAGVLAMPGILSRLRQLAALLAFVRSPQDLLSSAIVGSGSHLPRLCDGDPPGNRKL
jgi:hypothetical protein